MLSLVVVLNNALIILYSFSGERLTVQIYLRKKKIRSKIAVLHDFYSESTKKLC